MSNSGGKAQPVPRKEFKDDQPKNFPTLGAKLSKYSSPETNITQPYSNARLGFILGSPILYLKEGVRIVDINLKCTLLDSICNEMEEASIASSKNCCDKKEEGTTTLQNDAPQPAYPPFYSAVAFYDKINTIINKTYYYINENLLKEAVDKGINPNLIDELRNKYLIEKQTGETIKCYCPSETRKYENVIESTDFEKDFKDQRIIIYELVYSINIGKNGVVIS